MPESVTAHVMKQRDNSETVDNFLRAPLRQASGHPSIRLHECGKYALSDSRTECKLYQIRNGWTGRCAFSGQKPVDESWGADDPDNFGELTTAADEKGIQKQSL